MSLQLRPLHEQVMVITGATSGIGLVTARQAAERGASLVLAARNGTDLTHTVENIRSAGGRAVAVVADVADPQQVDAIATAALDGFGRIDTWINNAAVSVYGPLVQVPIEDMRQQFEVIYWGTVHGSLAAVRHLRARGGALINVGSGLSDRAIPLQGTYCAAKHALKGFTDALRMELEDERAPISVTLVKPASINTPFYDKARTYLGVEPRPIQPVYAPEVVAEVILHAATHPVREIIAGGAAAGMSLARLAPRVADLYMERWFTRAVQSDRPTGPDRPDNLYGPTPWDGGERSRSWNGYTASSSVATSAMLYRPFIVAAAAAALVGAAWRLSHRA